MVSLDCTPSYLSLPGAATSTGAKKFASLQERFLAILVAIDGSSDQYSFSVADVIFSLLLAFALMALASSTSARSSST